MRLRHAGITAAALTAAIAVTGCGSDDKESSSASSSGDGAKTVNVYSSLPLQGGSKTQTNAMVDGMKLALKEAGDKAGDVSIKYTSLDDSTAEAGKWDPQVVNGNAKKVAQDDAAIAYIGEFNSGASALSIPLTNQAKLAQISPANTAVGLTSSGVGADTGEPAKYYPTGKRTYARIVPKDTVQGAALVKVAKEDGCTTMAIANDKEVYGAGLAKVIVSEAEKNGIKVAANEGIDPKAANFRALASKFKSGGANCFIFAGVTANGAVQIYKDVAAALPKAKFYGPDGVCESDFTKKVPAAVQDNFSCTVATVDLNSQPKGKEFLAAFKKEYNVDNPDPYSIYGYEVMQLVIDTIKAGGTDRESFLTKLFETKDRQSAIGTYSIDKNGDTTLTVQGLFKVNAKGEPEFDKAIE